MVFECAIDVSAFPNTLRKGLTSGDPSPSGGDSGLYWGCLELGGDNVDGDMTDDSRSPPEGCEMNWIGLLGSLARPSFVGDLAPDSDSFVLRGPLINVEYFL